MNMYQLQLLDSVFKTNNLAKTAEEFNCAYQNVAYQLNKLDEEFGIKILTKSKNGSVFTNDGLIFYSYAIKILESYNNLKTEIEKKSTKIRFGVDLIYIPPIISDFFVNNLDKGIEAVSFPYKKLMDALLDNKIDCYFGHESTWHKSIYFEPIYMDSLSIVTCKNSYLTNMESISFNNLTDFTIDLSMYKSIISNKLLDKIPKTSKVILDNPVSMVRYELVKGTAISIIPSMYKSSFSSNVSFVPIDNSPVQYGLFYRERSIQICEILSKLHTLNSLDE
ncbi:MAG: LysR family transcriptional regulator [Solobacterium sp.]|nr:LysR family transcriptional regulator [Solobacterium sp.]